MLCFAKFVPLRRTFFKTMTLLTGRNLQRTFLLLAVLLSVHSLSYKSISPVRLRQSPLHASESENDLQNVENVLSGNNFKELGGGEIPQWLLERCEKLGYNTPTPVQNAALPAVFEGQDVILQAQTGSGKTLVYR